MDRKEIYNMFDDNEHLQKQVQEVVDYMETKFNEIRDILSSVKSISHLDRIVDAFNIADSMSDKLY